MTNWKTYILMILSLIPLVLSAQSERQVVEAVYKNANHSKVVKYSFDKRYEYLVLASGFSQEQVKEIPFTDRRILKIDLVYTTFRESEEFDQKELDLARLEKLVKINPEIIVNKFFDWNVIGQTGCNSSPECLDFFHGFVIYYEPYYTKEVTRVEIDSIKTDLSRLTKKITEYQNLLKVDYERIDCEYPESYYSEEYLSEKLKEMYDCADKFRGRVFYEATMDYHGRPQEVIIKGSLFPCKEILSKRLKAIFKWKRGLVIGHQQFDLIAKGYVSFPLNKESVHITSFEIDKKLIDQYQMLQQYSQCVAYETDTSFVDIIPKVRKRVVSEVLYRHDWRPELIVADVTGSMYPYTADLLKWVRLNTIEPTDFVFFNDGDDKPTEQKFVGHTGGIYHVTTSDFQEARDKMFEAMRAGGGGDLPENNFEALMYGFKEADPTGEVVMIADNYSFPRDESLVTNYGGLLRIILCHTEMGINTKYLNLARKYGFTIHTLKSDIEDLQKNELKIEGHTYRMTKTGFQKAVKY